MPPGSSRQRTRSKYAYSDILRARNDGAAIRSPAARFASGFCRNLVPPDQEGQGMPGAGRTRRPCGLKRKSAHKSVQVSRHDRHSLRNGFTACSALSLVSGRFSHHPPRALDPGVDPSVGGSGPHGLTVRRRCIRLPHQQRPSRPAQRFVTMAKRLCSEHGMVSLSHKFCNSERYIFLRSELDSSGKTGGGNTT
jgi:hypothetical protein